MSLDKLEQDLDRLGSILAPNNSVVPAVVARVDGLPMQSIRSIQLRRWFMRASIGLAACAAAVFLFINAFSHPAAAWADVQDKVQHTRTLTFDIDGQGQELMYISIKGDWLRAELPNDQIVDIWNRTTGKMLSLDAKNKLATTMTLARQPFDFYTLLKDFKDGKEESLGEKELNGKAYSAFKITRSLPAGGDTTAPAALLLWIDPSSGLPVQAQTTLSGHDLLLKNLKFDSEIADNLFDTAVPQGFKAQNLGGIASDQLKRAPTTQEAMDTLTLKPNIGLGTLAFGDSMDKVIAVLGQPEQTRTTSDLGYPSKGIFVFVDPKRGLLTVVAMSRKSAGPFAMNDFAGKTDRGVGIGATRAELEATYGKPTNVSQNSLTTTILDYTDLNITFSLYGDQVVQIFMKKSGT
jgi:hypothetical protein